ncbi:glycosyltransferase family A protein [Stigmatella sp. ncwal1]|uniref:Glycosyltransferase family A protein n=1 Tax=Stigmatella ashevillensis TaxID=2995309 RepID=A0ABT5DAG3_9BACT|nr:glycosyltransferase family A protein [Stigmatella ashevillena]MDC0710670.1 glycosyltransferase family A protein [Stigmatella ashevillena]
MQTAQTPRVSILMPTYRQSPFIRRALEGLRAQRFQDWELIILDDGSDDDTQQVLQPYLNEPRIRYHRLDRNSGLGHALGLATSMARGQYIAYLPSDDVYYPEHLEQLAALLDASPDVYLAYGGVHWTVRSAYSDQIGRGQYWTNDRHEPTLLGSVPENAEADVLERVRDQPEDNNLLALVQVMHRRTLESTQHWPPRSEVVSDRLEANFWRGLLSQGARFAYSGAVSCERVLHTENHSNLILNVLQGGLSRYREHYGIAQGEALNWQPSRGFPVDERVAYARWRTPRPPPARTGLKILLVGELGFNAERILAFEEQGHTLSALWSRAEIWDMASTTAYGHIENIPADSRWRQRVREIQPDIIYALLNWQALPLIDTVLDAQLGIPMAFHFKEAPFFCYQRGLWPTLMRVLSQSDGQILINEESFEWYQYATDGMLQRDNVLILDGDLVKREWMTDEWAPKLSDQDGQLHTVCTGRPLGLDPRESPKASEFVMSILQAGIHVHLYGGAFFQNAPREFLDQLRASGLVHTHPPVGPADWVRVLSQYDAAWCHIFTSSNQGELRRADWIDLNLPARLGTYASAGLPWILRDNSHSRVALDALARRLDVGIFVNNGADLARQLRDRPRLQQLSRNMRETRSAFCFDDQLPPLVDFFHRLIARRRGA